MATCSLILSTIFLLYDIRSWVIRNLHHCCFLPSCCLEYVFQCMPVVNNDYCWDEANLEDICIQDENEQVCSRHKIMMAQKSEMTCVQDERNQTSSDPTTEITVSKEDKKQDCWGNQLIRFGVISQSRSRIRGTARG
ncbi:hypothetical protein CAPTEDRAFT_200157 [Capitella teleta]|uniref:FZ domain-containing protein n=1 Tax=Capitella teleta TaxID=283909 RepID=R7TVP9_CAPTE|nr:hypothetical protein CAPTEDRAFT_200157 [Capitella teleta]|eukprot:ELT97662.1 hypothetical protein CAPTEDRAFT_200157 [Capitella teleta]